MRGLQLRARQLEEAPRGEAGHARDVLGREPPELADRRRNRRHERGLVALSAMRLRG